MGRNKDHEQLQALDVFVEDGPLEEVIGVVKSGKEATVYACRHDDGRLVAAKVYRDRDVRRFSNDAAYMEGRTRGMRRRDALAITMKSRAGREISFGKWVADEYETLRILHGAGAAVPEPITRSGRVIIMEFIGDEGGAAQPLASARLEPDEARRIFASLIDNIELALSVDRVHGDLSPYNVLYHAGEVRMIDFPQAVDARFNSNALQLLERDIDNICRYFARAGVESDAYRIAQAMWSRFLRSGL